VNHAEKTEFKEWEGTPYFDGCLPIEVMAARGMEVMRHGPLKPFGLTNPHDPQTKAYAVVQLRQDNKLGTLFNMVGFQTKLKHGEQVRIFRMIPGLEHAEFARLGGLHRNTYLDSPRLLDGTLRLKASPRLRFAGQITGCEGYVESASVGLMAGLFAAAERRGEELRLPPPTTALGALLAHITGGHIAGRHSADENAPARSYQPMNINFGLFPPAEELRKPTGGKQRGSQRAISRKQAITSRAKADLESWLGKAKADAA
jgi:methylenetetrahydrofolate--tRNA-(uracil-5-)-methyltransferase